MDKVANRSLTEENVAQINCCPGGLEVQGKGLKGDLRRTITWRRDMLRQGMTGIVSYHDGVPRGFAEYMPAETAPFPIEAPGAVVLMCYHWEPIAKEDQEEHLAQEKRLVKLVETEARESFTGLATLGWDNPVHFPIQMLEETFDCVLVLRTLSQHILMRCQKRHVLLRLSPAIVLVGFPRQVDSY